MQHPNSCTIKTRLRTAKYKWTKITLNNIVINNNPTRKVIGIVEDITEHQEFQFLKLFQATLKKALVEDSMGYAHINLSQDKVSEISGIWQEYFDNSLEYTYVYFLKKLISFVHPEDKEKAKHVFSKENILENIKKDKIEDSLELRVIKADNEVISIFLNIKPCN